MTSDLALKVVIIAAFVCFVYSMIAYHVRFTWTHSRAGRIMMSAGSALALSSGLGIVGVYFPDAPWRPFLRIIAWLLILLIALTWGVSVTIIKKPKGTKPEI